MSKIEYCIIYDQSKKQISLGDLVRVLTIFKNENYFLVTNKKNSLFFKNLIKKKVKDIKNFDLKKYKGQIVNLVIGRMLKNSFFDINKFIKKEPTKLKTYKIFDSLQNKINKSLKEVKLKKKLYKIGFNSIVPKEWYIKSYPSNNWNKVQNNLKNSKNKFIISKQKNTNLNKYLNWIKSCDLIISVVGLGVHIANYLDKKVVLLVGPTDFSESAHDINIYKIFPSKRCNIHKKKLNIFYKHCFCMDMIDPKKINNKIIKILN